MGNKKLYLYTVFHLNLAYSSIEEEVQSEVIKSCYLPLLDLAAELSLPLGIEATGYTLEKAASIEPGFIEKLRSLTESGPCEFIGSGYSQIIGPLVPPQLNRFNLEEGHRVYEELLGLRPKIALVNEQAYAAGLLKHYIDAGYQAIIMEWDNPAASHPDWQANYLYYPQYACDQTGNEIILIWNNSIAFQKFQRFAHGDLELDQYIDYLASNSGERVRFFPLYGNDVEIFNFRPGRFATEPALYEEDEWEKIKALFLSLKNDHRFKIVSPHFLLSELGKPGSGNKLSLESAARPVEVKKQGKYNLTRWAVTGSDDLGINTTCHAIFSALENDRSSSREKWRELCYLWSSDFRTHITEKRWNKYVSRLLAAWNLTKGKPANGVEVSGDGVDIQSSAATGDIMVSHKGKYLDIESDSIALELNCKKGLSINRLWFGSRSAAPVIGTLHHGYYNDITYGADWFSGHLVFEPLGRPKVTDLEAVEPEISYCEEKITIKAVIRTALGDIIKTLQVYKYMPKLTISYRLDWGHINSGSFRLGYVTLIPEAFDRESLYYMAGNGGFKPEVFKLRDKSIDHGRAVSFMVSASGGLGLTDRCVELGDSRHGVRIELGPSSAAMIGLVKYEGLRDSYFYRIGFSAGEVDETRKAERVIPGERNYEFIITPGKGI